MYISKRTVTTFLSVAVMVSSMLVGLAAPSSVAAKPRQHPAAATDEAGSDKQSGTTSPATRVTIVVKTTASGCSSHWIGPYRARWKHGSKGYDRMRSSFLLRRCQHGASIRRIGGRYDIKGTHMGCRLLKYMRRAVVTLRAWTPETSHRRVLRIGCDTDTKRHREIRVRGMNYPAPPCPQPTCPVVLHVDLEEKIDRAHWWDLKRLFELLVA